MNSGDFKSLKTAVKNIVNEAMSAENEASEPDPISRYYGVTGMFPEPAFDHSQYVARIDALLGKLGVTRREFAEELKVHADKGVNWNNDCDMILQCTQMAMGMDLWS